MRLYVCVCIFPMNDATERDDCGFSNARRRILLLDKNDKNNVYIWLLLFFSVKSQFLPLSAQCFSTFFFYRGLEIDQHTTIRF